MQSNIKYMISKLRRLVKVRNELEIELKKVEEELEKEKTKIDPQFLLYEDISKVEEVIKNYRELKREAERLRSIINKKNIEIEEINKKLLR